MLVDLDSLKRKFIHVSAVLLLLVVSFAGPASAQSSGSLNVGMVVSPASDVPLGGIVTYTINIYNPTSQTISNVSIQDTLPTGVEFQSWVGAYSATISNNVISGTSDIAPGQSLTVEFTAAAPNNTSFYNSVIHNSVVYSSDSGDSGAAPADFTLSGPPTASVSLNFSHVPQVITDTISIANNSSNPALGFTLTDTLPDHTTFGGWIQQSGASLSGNQISFQGDLEGNASLNIQYLLVIDSDPAFSGQTVSENLQYTFTGSQPVTIASNIQIPYRILLPITGNSVCPSNLPIFTCSPLP